MWNMKHIYSSVNEKLKTHTCYYKCILNEEEEYYMKLSTYTSRKKQDKLLKYTRYILE